MLLIQYTQVLCRITGTDASELFEEIGRHTAGAREIMNGYCIGELLT